MRRTVEWILAAVGALVSVGGAAAVWGAQSAGSVPGESLWPLPALVLIEMALLGLAGLIAVALDRGERRTRWGIVTWIAAGGLAALMILGALSIGPILLPAVLAFLGAALLADRRGDRGALAGLGVFTLGAVVNLTVLFLLIAAVRA